MSLWMGGMKAQGKGILAGLGVVGLALITPAPTLQALAA